MLKEIRLKNFKCFREETTFPLSTINLLTGINGRGKSTLLQSMLLMKQSVEHNEYTNKLILNGNCVNLGTYGDLHNNESALEDKIEIYFNYKDDETESNLNILYELEKEAKVKLVDVSYSYKNDNKLNEYKDSLKRIEFFSTHKLCFQSSHFVVEYDNRFKEHIQSFKNPSKETQLLSYQLVELKNLLPNVEFMNTHLHGIVLQENVLWNIGIKYMNFYSRTHYVAADRLGSQEYYKKINLNDFISVDKKGENLATVLFELQKDLIKINKKLYLGDGNELEEQVGKWLSQIFDTKVEIKVKDSSHTFEILFTIKGKQYKPTNVGFGYSYILPIIVSGLIAKEGEILIIENPEAHLHPKAQSELTKFLAKVASCGVQIFIESHSEHILNGLQVTAKQEEFEITNEDINILYFHDNEDTYFTQIPLKPNGKIEVWKDGFFDQSEKDLDTILGL
jgi:predicted ATPase